MPCPPCPPCPISHKILKMYVQNGVRRCARMFNLSILMIQGSDHVKNNKIPNTLPLPALL